MRRYGRIGVIGRFKPLHKGAAVMLDALCEQAGTVMIGIGSSNKYNARNPFTAEETEGMIREYLAGRHDNYTIVHIPDFAQDPRHRDGQRWRSHVKSCFGDLDLFVSGNPYVQGLLGNDYDTAHPAALIPRDRWVIAKGSQVRLEMARGGDWKRLVHDTTIAYLTRHGLVERFLQEFRSETIRELEGRLSLSEDPAEEYTHTMEE